MAKQKTKPEKNISSPSKVTESVILRIGKKTDKWFSFVIFIFAFLLYSNTLHHGFVMDDGAVISNHETVKKGFAGIKELFGQSSVYGSTKENFGTYRPLTMTLFAIEWSFFKDNSSAYHFVQILLYAILCVVIFILLKKLLKDYHPLLPFITVLLFAAHPIHTEVTANIKSADEILSLLFCSLGLLFSIKFSETSSNKFLVISFLFFLCALFSKESAATFILIIPLALYFFTLSSRKNILILLGVYVFAIAIYFLARNSALDKSPEGVALINNALAGAQSLDERYATISVTLLNYLKLLFLPHPLCWDYGYNQIPLVGFGNPMAIVSVLIYVALGIFAVAVLFKRKIAILTAHYSLLFSFCILFYLIGLSVSSNIFVLIGSTMAERFLFTPSLAFCIMLAFALIKLLKIESFSIRTIPLAIILVLFSYKTFSRTKDWKNNLTLFAKGVEDCPNSYRTNTTFAWESVLAGEKETDKEKKNIHLQNAVIYYQKGLAIYDKVEADWYNYGVSLSNLGKVDEAVKAYQRALEINPKHRNSLYNLATVYLSRKDYQNALSYFLRMYETEPDFMDVSFKTGLIYHMGGNPQKAIPYYERYLKNNPNNKDVINNLSMAYNAVGEKEKANQLMLRLQQLK
ncbi:MAG: tetratricopeptide repeat protein [Bacteroidetes bacterium]|nr:tetratricopeptide repeat protein [Bacteroidota bacterium]